MPCYVSLRGWALLKTKHQRDGHAAGLFELGNDGALLSPDERFSVRSTAKVEAGRPGRVRIHRILPVRRGRFQVAILKEHHHNVFVMEVHRRGHVGRPGVIPDNHAVVFQELLRAGAGKRQRILGGIGIRGRGMVFQIDHNRSSINFGRGAFGQERGIAVERHHNGIRRLGSRGVGHIPDGNAVIFDDRFLRRRRTGLEQRNAEQQGTNHGNRLSGKARSRAG